MTIPGHHIRKRLLRNKGALFGLTVILISVLTAIFAYFLAPDGSPDANRIIVEIGGRPPGFRQLFLQLKKERQPPSTGFLHRLLDGREDLYDYIPINSIVAKGDSVIVQKFVDEGVEEQKAYPLSAIPPGHAKTITFWLGTDKYGRDILSRLLIGVRVSLAVGLVTVLLSLTIGVLLGALAGYFGGRVDELILWLINVIWSIPTLLLVFAIMLLLGKGFWQVFIAIGLTL
jgi:peptide/nickel transport system permease protein